jgi:hypothetical protein
MQTFKNKEIFEMLSFYPFTANRNLLSGHVLYSGIQLPKGANRSKVRYCTLPVITLIPLCVAQGPAVCRDVQNTLHTYTVAVTWRRSFTKLAASVTKTNLFFL